jgi:hypothetical protein
VTPSASRWRSRRPGRSCRRTLLADWGEPQLLLRLGWASISAEPVPRTGRRPLDETIVPLAAPWDAVDELHLRAAGDAGLLDRVTDPGDELGFPSVPLFVRATGPDGHRQHRPVAPTGLAQRPQQRPTAVRGRADSDHQPGSP